MTILSNLVATTKKYTIELSKISFFVFSVATITNWFYRIFHFDLAPIFEYSIGIFHDFFHFILSLFVYSWLTKLIELILYGLLWISSWITPLIPWRIQITIPELYTDFALLSLAITRVFASADLSVPRSKRADAENQTTQAQYDEIDKSEGLFWSTIHKSVHFIGAQIWNLIDWLHSILIYPFPNSPKFHKIVRSILKSLAASVLFWGFIRPIGYIINLIASRKLSSPIMNVRREVFRYFSLYLFAAIVASGIFFLVNGWWLV